MIGLTLPVIILGSLALALADYLYRKFLAPPVPDTSPLSPPYTPPFTGGQCAGEKYNFTVTYFPGGRTEIDNRVDITGAIGSAYFTYNDGISDNYSIPTGQGPIGYRSSRVPIVSNVVKFNGSIDQCGDLPNPIPGLPIGGGGLAKSPPPVLYPPSGDPNANFYTIIAGIAAIAGVAATAAIAAGTAATAAASAAATAAAASASAAGAASAAGSAAAAAASAAEGTAIAIGKIAEAIAQVIKLILELEKEIRKLKTKEADKDKEKAKKVVRYDFGSANKDGFITLYPINNPDTFVANFIDIRIFNIPMGSGKYFGDKSPHYYKYKSLGQIHFVSPTFGILESREIDFARLSLNVPDNCFGFFYHFGLDGVINANISAFYTKTEKQSE